MILVLYCCLADGCNASSAENVQWWNDFPWIERIFVDEESDLSANEKYIS